MMLFKKIVFDCSDATFLFIKKEDGKITFPERVKLWIHLLRCDPCRNFIRQSAVINQAGKKLRGLMSVNPPFKLSDTVRGRIQAEINKGS